MCPREEITVIWLREQMTVFQPLFQILYRERLVSVLSESLCLLIDRVDFLFWIFFASFCTALQLQLESCWNGRRMRWVYIYIDQDVDMETRLWSGGCRAWDIPYMDREHEMYHARLFVDTRIPTRLCGFGLCSQKKHAGASESYIGTGRFAFENPGNGRQNHPSLVETMPTANGEDQNFGYRSRGILIHIVQQRHWCRNIKTSRWVIWWFFDR